MAGTSIPRTVLYGIDGKPLDLRRGWVIQSIVPVAAGNAVLVVPENAERVGLAFMVIGASSVCVKPLAKGEALGNFAFGQGAIYLSNGVGEQGASENFGGTVPCNAFAAICKQDQASALLVWESVPA